MANENPIAKKIIKGQRIVGRLPRDYNMISSSLGAEILETSTGRRFLQGIPITQQSLAGLGQEERQEDILRRDNFLRDIHQAIRLTDVTMRNILNDRRVSRFSLRGIALQGEEVALVTAGIASSGIQVTVESLFENLRDLVGLTSGAFRLLTVAGFGDIADRSGQQQFEEAIRRFSNLNDYTEIAINNFSWYFPFELRILLAINEWVDQLDRGQIPTVTRNVVEIIRDMTREADVSIRSSWGGTRFTFVGDGDIEDLENGISLLRAFVQYAANLRLGLSRCAQVEAIIKNQLRRGRRLEIVAEAQSNDPLLDGNIRGSITNFSLQTPLVLDDCSVEDLISNITTEIETATVESVYQLYVDPNGDTPRFPPNTNLTQWPGREFGGFREFWDTALRHERDTQVKFNTTYYGNLNSKNKGGFPRYAGLSIPTYQASSFVNLFTELDAERSFYPHIVRMLEGEEEREYELNWEYYDAVREWIPDDSTFSLKQTDLSRHLHHLQQGGNEEADIFDVVPDQSALAEELGVDLSGLIPEIQETMVATANCPRFSDRLRALLADQRNHDLIEETIDAQLNSPQGLFIGLITGELEYTEPIFYKITRERLVGLNIEESNIGHLMVRSGVPVLGGQPIFHANKAGKNYFTFEDRFVDYGDAYQYNIDAYTVVMTVEYETISMTREQVDCIPSINLEDIERRLGEDVVYSLIAFKPKFDIINIPYVNTRYQEDEIGIDDRKLAVALPPVRIVDKPPIAPGVNIIPYRGVADKMLFMFDFQTDKIIDEYIHLTQDEKIKFEAIHRTQKIKICDLCENTVEFASEGEDIQMIQIFRTTVVPEIISEQNPSQLYRDAFGSEPYREIDATQGSAFVDDIQPNTKYFYMFRVTDKNGHVSNPSHIYRVEMVQEDGLIFPVIELYTPQKIKRGVKYRKMAKHLEIKPSLLMAEPNWSADDNNNLSWKIGAREDNIFGRSLGANGRAFKICLTSIDTGRKIEIKVRFNKEENKVEVTEDRDLGE